MSTLIDDLVLEEVRSQDDNFAIVYGDKVWYKKYILENWDKDDEMWGYLTSTLMIDAEYLKKRKDV